MENGTLARIRQALPELSGALRACADFVLAHAWEMRGRSIREVAAGSGVSTNAVNRFTRRLGYAGYRDFSNALVMELGRIEGAAYALPEPLAQALDATDDAADSPASIVSRAFALELSALRDTLRALDSDAVTRAVTALAGAERLLLTGTGAGAGVVQTAAFHFSAFGIAAGWSADPATTIAQIHLLREGDVLVGVSFHGGSHTIVEGLKHARGRGITTISITAMPGSPASRAADIALIVSAPDGTFAFGQFASRVSTATLLEALVSAVAWVRRDAAVPHAREVTQINQFLHAARVARPHARRARK